MAAAISLPDGSHHLWMGCPTVNGWEEGGWHHAVSDDLVHWRSMGIDVRAISESHGSADAPDTPAPMKSRFTPCAGFATVDDATGELCVGLRQCYSRVGLPGGHAWDVPLELRCANISGRSSPPRNWTFQPRSSCSMFTSRRTCRTIQSDPGEVKTDDTTLPSPQMPATIRAPRRASATSAPRRCCGPRPR